MPLHHGLRSAAGASPADPYFSITSLLLLGNGTNGGQNNTFVDSSTNNFTITRNGNTTQGSFSPFSAPDGRWSNYFDGSGDYLSVADNAAFDVGSGDWTIEAWIYINTAKNYNGIYGKRQAGASQGLNLGIDSSNTLTIAVSNNSSSWALAGASLGGGYSAGTWHHVAVTRSGTTITAWRNGVSTGTQTLSGSIYPATGYPAMVGSMNDLSQEFNGYISNFRFVKGTALYTSSFTPSTAPLTAITNTSLLTCQSNRFKDNSSNAFAITPSGNAAVTSFSPFAPLAEYSAGSNGGSGYFDGSGDYLSVAANSAIQFGTGDFTIEFWVYPLQSGRQDMIDMPGTNRIQVVYEGTNTAVYINTTFVCGSAVAPAVNAWNHIVATRSGTNTRVFLNGTQLGSTATNSTNFSNNSLKTNDTTSGAVPLRGYMAGVRVVKGGALYTANFTVPTGPPTTTVSSGTVGALLNFTNASIIDSTAKNDLETVGNAQISTSVKRYGTGSMAFDGTGDYCVVNGQTSDFAFGTGNFTIECWIYISSLPSTGNYASIYDPRALNDASNGYGTLFIKGSTFIYYSNPADRITSAAISANTWYHVAVARTGSSTRLFVDGTQAGSTYTDTTSYKCGSSRPLIGTSGYSPNTLNFNGYIDDLRITKGVARYTSNFTPPSAQLPSR